MISNKTCIKFVFRNSQPDWIDIGYSAKGCSAPTGNQKGHQEVYLNKGRCLTGPTVAHMFMHVLG